ncbi:MAG: hypothetical protein FJ276_19150 [Planctomycetes bacterium]|nr:hypothetical protein [Planctomycetota bacterium]
MLIAVDQQRHARCRSVVSENNETIIVERASSEFGIPLRLHLDVQQEEARPAVLPGHFDQLVDLLGVSTGRGHDGRQLLVQEPAAAANVDQGVDFRTETSWR